MIQILIFEGKRRKEFKLSLRRSPSILILLAFSQILILEAFLKAIDWKWDAYMVSHMKARFYKS